MARQWITQGSTFEQQVGYSRAVIDGDWVHVSGTTGFDYATMSIATDVVEQCRQTLANITAALQQAGSSPDDIVRVTYVIPNRDDFELCWPLLREFFANARPAATAIVAELIDERIKIEIEVTAHRQPA